MIANNPKNPLALIVEDDEKLSMIFAQAMKMADFDTQIVRDGEEAQAALNCVDPAVVVLDLHLPVVSGDKILAFIRNEPRLAKTKVIIATADPAMANLVEEQSDLVLIKPVSFTQLRDLAERIRYTIE
jgi:DNA-binding response OmpR family regulator